MYVKRRVTEIVLQAADPVFRGMRNRRIVMFHAGRSGSRVIGQMLHQHPQLYWAHELFRRQLLMRYTRKNPEINFREIIRKDEFRAGTSNYGFEMKFQHFDPIRCEMSEFLDTLEHLGYTHYIHLIRENLLRRQISSMIAGKLRKFHVRAGEAYRFQPIRVDVELLMNKLNFFHASVKAAEHLLAPRQSLTLTYENDILSDPRVATRKVFEFLDLPAVQVEPTLKRTNPYPLPTLIVNYQEVSDALAPTPYAWMLEDDRY